MESDEVLCPHCWHRDSLSCTDLIVHLDPQGEWHEMQFECSACESLWIETLDVSDLVKLAGR